ncbi:disulfide bond formation protein B [Pseudomonas aeruginosa]|uniref:disulfide bond formation protein B n=1 Tax=Pseudomonas aeruginosa TaxID=287 RepID=UPI0038573D76
MDTAGYLAAAGLPARGLCGEVVWTLLGQSMAVWSLALFVFCLLVLAAKLAFGRRTA